MMRKFWYIEMAKNKQTFVFDLDDTLYAEANYVRSGKLVLAEIVQQLFGVDLNYEILKCSDDFIQLICEKIRMPEETQSSLLWAYRLHRPNIALRDGVTECLEFVRSQGSSICIITDGRSITQRLKIAALNLNVDGIYISEELGVEKPDPLAFKKVQEEWPGQEYFYVGDNITKDFVAPNQMGWTTIGLTRDEQAIHQIEAAVPQRYEPSLWVDTFSDLTSYLLNGRRT